MNRLVALAASAVLVAAAGTSAPLPASAATAAPPGAAGGASLRAYVVPASPELLGQLGQLGVDRREVTTRRGPDGRLAATVVLDRGEAAKLRAAGFDLRVKQARSSTAARAAGEPVFRPYSGDGGLREELEEIAQDHPDLVKLVEIGRTVQDTPILAAKVTRDARTSEDGSRPATIYASAQHAREWITPEMTRRLLHHYLDGYGSDAALTEIVDTTELWFVVVANPDGYDYSFTEGNRLWRKNLRDNNGDGQITGLDGVDLNRNFATRWGYDNEGSSPTWSSATYRGPSPQSEPETQAMDGLFQRVTAEFLVNYHSAAELLLYGTGWQVATPTPDDVIYEALAGDDADPAVPGYDPDISAELYTTNGDTDTHAHDTYGTLGFTPEMTTCETASAQDPDDAFEPEDCESGFNFPDSEELVQAEFEKNIPFALSVAASAVDPQHPVTVTGEQTPDFVVDAFPVSHGSTQPVAVTARRSLTDLQLRWSVDGGPVQTAPTAEWGGGERYGGELDRYYGEFRGTVTGAAQGARVEVWFTARSGSSSVTSESFTYRQQTAEPPPVLIVSDEDVDGVNPDYPAGTDIKYAGRYRDALRANGIGSAVFNADRSTPHDLGVLQHYDAVIWYLGDNRLTQDPEDELTDFGNDQLPDLAVAEREQYLTLAVRDYLNGGGKLMHSGETAGYFGLLGADLGGVYYGLDGAPEADCQVVQDPFADCLLLSDDFVQYYLGGHGRNQTPQPSAVEGTSAPLAGQTYRFGRPSEVRAVRDNPLDEAGSFSVTSELLPPEEFPQFLSEGASRYVTQTPGAFDPVEGSWYVAGLHQDDSYVRLARTVDLAGATAADDPQLRFQLSYSTEADYDHVLVEARPVGTDDWTTLPDLNGGTTSAVPAECEAGFLLEEHPFLLHYLTAGAPCTARGTTGTWHAFTGDSGGWQQVAVDLSDYAGGQVEVAIAYVTDPATGGNGAFVDDTRVVVGGEVTESEGFETGLGDWSIEGAPEGSAPNLSEFSRTQVAFASTVTTEDSVLLGYGFEHLSRRGGAAADLMGRVMGHLLARPDV